jgi:hypothetical protein
MWRLSPLSAFFETIWMWLWMADGLASKRAFRATFVALLATRLKI